MKKGAFDLLQKAEQSWWYKGRALAIHAALARSVSSVPKGAILDFGAGFGGMYTELVRFGSQVDAFEPDEYARQIIASRGYRSIFTTATEALANRYNLIGLFDVVEHVEDDRSFLQSFNEALTAEGLIVITVPAFQFLWSEHDRSHQHFRRYNTSSLRRLFSDSGYDILVISYWNTLLFIPAAVMRLLGQSGSSALTPPTIINELLLCVVTLEAKILRFCSLPFGLSLVVVARKKIVSVHEK